MVVVAAVVMVAAVVVAAVAVAEMVAAVVGDPHLLGTGMPLPRHWLHPAQA